MNTLKAEKRDMTIKAKKLRREGFVTGCIFGREMTESIPLKMTKKDVDQLLKTEGKGGRVRLEVEGQTFDALIKEVDYNAMKGWVDEIDFQALVSTEKVHSSAEDVYKRQLTPHAGAATKEAVSKMSYMAAENLVEVLKTGKCRYAV